jgi:hypothetical protein
MARSLERKLRLSRDRMFIVDVYLLGRGGG